MQRSASQGPNPVIGTPMLGTMEFQSVNFLWGAYADEACVMIEVLVNVIKTEGACQVAVSIPAREDSNITSADLCW